MDAKVKIFRFFPLFFRNIRSTGFVADIYLLICLYLPNIKITFAWKTHIF